MKLKRSSGQIKEQIKKFKSTLSLNIEADGKDWAAEIERRSCESYLLELEKELVKSLAYEKKQWKEMAIRLAECLRKTPYNECDQLSHTKKDQHGWLDECPVEAKNVKTLKDFDDLILNETKIS